MPSEQRNGALRPEMEILSIHDDNDFGAFYKNRHPFRHSNVDIPGIYSNRMTSLNM